MENILLNDRGNCLYIWLLVCTNILVSEYLIKNTFFFISPANAQWRIKEEAQIWQDNTQTNTRTVTYTIDASISINKKQSIQIEDSCRNISCFTPSLEEHQCQRVCFVSGHVRLSDFGLSRRLKRGGRAFTICGTIQYMGEILVSFPRK